MKPTQLFAAHHQRCKLNLSRSAHNWLYELGLRQSIRSSQSISQQVQLEAKANQKQFYD